MIDGPPLAMDEEVAQALAAGRPVVALESTIITHGMPFPQNLETARRVEATVRDNGAVPATIAAIGGQLRVGLSDDTLDALARTSGCRKLSRADLAHALARGDTGSTTVAATMIAARLAGIGVFATGGIGGVHRDVGDSHDISADLQELAATSVVVVSSGVKAILDIPRTLEVMETLGVPVIAFGQDAFPAFWSRDGGLAAPLRLDTAAEVAAHQHMRVRLGLSGGTLVANPAPAQAEIPREVLEPVIAQALQEAHSAGIAGKSVTPFLLGRIMELTDGASLRTNIALIEGNAACAARIAAALSDRAIVWPPRVS